MKNHLLKIKQFINKQLEYGTCYTEDKILQKQVIKVNFFYYGFCIYFIFISTLNLVQKHYSHAVEGYIYILILVAINIIFMRLKNANLYTNLFALILTFSLIKILIDGAYRGSSLIAVSIMIIVIMNITKFTLGVLLSLFIILFEIFVYKFNNTFKWLYNYPELLEDLLIRFICTHIGIFAFICLSIKKRNELILKAFNEKREKEQLFINIVHDIKTPLTMIHNSIDKCLYEENTNEAKEILKSNIIRMEKNIINILNIERIEKGLFSNSGKVTNVSILTKDICNLYNEYALSRGLILNQEIEKDICVEIDETSFMEIISNLLDNAFKFTNSGGEILVSINKSFGKVEIRIEDTGIGISEIDQEKIFNKFHQAHRHYGSYYGLGIGLSFVKKVCEAYKGEIFLESIINKGSKFIIQFPESLNKDFVNSNITKSLFIPKLTKEPIRENKVSSKKILVVDDNNDIRNLLIKNLSISYNVTAAKNGFEALELCKDIGYYDLILTDIMMPVMDGEEFFNNLRNNVGDRITPVIFLTAKSSATDIIDYLSLGAIDFISKPFSIEELLIKVESVINTFNNHEDYIVTNINSHIKEMIANNFNKVVEDKEENENPDPNKLRLHSITRKEEDIIRDIWKGLTNKEIAERNNITISTVKTHIYRIYKKCNVNNSTNLVKLFYHY